METFECYVPNSQELQIASALLGVKDKELQYVAFSHLNEEELLILLSLCICGNLSEQEKIETKSIIGLIGKEKKYLLLRRTLKIIEEGRYQIDLGN